MAVSLFDCTWYDLKYLCVKLRFGCYIGYSMDVFVDNLDIKVSFFCLFGFMEYI